MKKTLTTLLAALLFLPMGLFGQTYDKLWKQVKEAQDKDLPRSAIAALQQIEAKSRKERAYGQLLKSTLLHSRLQAEVAPDSLLPAVRRLEQQEQAATDVALKAVYDAVLSGVWRENPQLGDDWQQQADSYRDKALARPDVLAGVKAGAYVPFVIEGKDSEVYGGDLLSVVGSELEAWQPLSAYYAQSGNRRAACLTALNVVKARMGEATTRVLSCNEYIRRLDSLTQVYGDLPEAGEIACERYSYMSHSTDATPAQRVAYLRQAIQRWGTGRHAERLLNYEKELTCPLFEARLPHSVGLPGVAQTLTFEKLRNLQRVTLRIYRTSLKGDTQLNPSNEKDYQVIKAGMKELTERAQTLPCGGHADYELTTDSVRLEGLPAGVYLLEFSSQPATTVSRSLCFVSGVRTLMQPQPDGSVRYVVVDARSGAPIAHAKLRVTQRKTWNKPAEAKVLTCDSRGEVVYKSEQPNVEVYAWTADDEACPEMNSYMRYSYYERNYGKETVSLFTDRSIYRPGQTVHVAAVAWKELSLTEQTAVEGRALTVQLRDANYKPVDEQPVTTDAYGKAACTFTLPQGQLNGMFTLRAGNGTASFRVEEYKRPTFQVEFADYDAPYQAGDTVKAQAKAVSYVGVPVQGARVHYTVKRRVAYWWLNYSWYWDTGSVGRGLSEEQLYEGEALTADDGTFEAVMPMMLPSDLGRRTMYYHFVVEADVTDVAGETRSGTMMLPLGTRPTALTCDLPQQVRSDQLPPLTFTRRNAAGKETSGTVSYRIDKGRWQAVAANVALSLPTSLKSGEHRLEAVCEQDSIDITFVVFSLGDTKPAAPTKAWFYISDRQFPRDGRPVTVQVGSSDPDLHIVYALYAGKKLIESGVRQESGSLWNRQFTYREEYGNGLLLTYAWVKDGECHRYSQFIQRPMPDKTLQLTWETFRDRLTPGQQEQWTLRVMAPDGRPADASLMAVLYDKSLDAIYGHSWSLQTGGYLAQPSTTWFWQAWPELLASGKQKINYQYSAEPTFSRFDKDVYPRYFARVLRSAQTVMYKSNRVSTAIGMAEAVDEVVVVGYGAGLEEVAVAADNGGADEAKPVADEVQVRENLQETAFFYPALQTDGEGRVALTFTLPESLTTWRFMGLANSRDMLTGQLGGEAVAQKEVMVQPNVPRFVRMGDEAHLSARIVSTADHAVSGQARLVLLDPETEQTVYAETQPFSVEAGQTTAATFRLSLADCRQSLLICRMTASGDGFSDGEQHYLPVLPNREYVTKTVPFTQHEPGVKAIDLAQLFPQDVSQQKLTIEYTNNPAWLMVQSLATVGQPWEHSAIDQAASYYSNLLGKTLLAQSPQVKRVFELWKQETGTETSLASSLQKDQELKDLVLAETPWVAAADREAAQKQRLADFFDENALASRLATAVEKLQQLQNGDGSFSWYPGMPGSSAITASVAEMLVRLNVMVGEQAATRQLLDKSLRYLDGEMVRQVAEMKRQEKKGVKPSFPSYTALRWLYVGALGERTLSRKVQSASDYLIALLKKDIKRQSIYEKAQSAVILARHKETRKALEYVQSLKEYTVYTEELGRYYDTPRAGYSWLDYRIPTEVAAIEAIHSVQPQDTQTIDEMRRWLLQEKRTQAWSTPINSVNAIYAFLFDHQDLLATREQTVLAIDGQPVDLPAATAGMGYVKTAIEQPEGRQLTATKTSEGTSWGAVYAQFFQKTADVEQSASGISVSREVPGTLKVGDRVKVRITIECSRDLDFVQVVDRRAACMEPVRQLSGYQNGAYCSPKDYATNYYYYGLPKGKHVIETEYYIDRAGQYETGTCSVQCAYAPEYRATAPSVTLRVGER